MLSRTRTSSAATRSSSRRSPGGAARRKAVARCAWSRGSPVNPILTPTSHWWERRAVFNPGAVCYKGFPALVYRAVGADGISRFGLAWGEEGERFPASERALLPWYEGAIDDPLARLGVE